MKLFTALGPGDIVAAHRAQMSGQPFSRETSIVFSGQVLEYCREKRIEVLALSCNSRADSMSDGELRIENKPRWCEKCGGVRYHLSRIAYAFYLALRAWRFRADLAIIDSGSAHYFALAAFKLIWIPVVINFHNTLWPNGFEPTDGVGRFVLQLDGWFFRHIVAATTGVSTECGRQVRQLARRQVPFFEYRTQYRCDEFPSAPRGDGGRNPFRVIYIGRIERNKGVFDIAAMAQHLRDRSQTPVLFDVCGQGSALEELKEFVTKNKIDDLVRIHGRVSRTELFQRFQRAHAVIVPTRSNFCEGLPAVCAEALLFGLPIVTSRLSNAIPMLSPAIAEAQPENIESYAGAILGLAADHAAYDRLCAACPELAAQFCDRSKSYPAALDRLIGHLLSTWKPLSDYGPLFARLGCRA